MAKFEEILILETFCRTYVKPVTDNDKAYMSQARDLSEELYQGAERAFTKNSQAIIDSLL